MTDDEYRIDEMPELDVHKVRDPKIRTVHCILISRRLWRALLAWTIFQTAAIVYIGMMLRNHFNQTRPLFQWAARRGAAHVSMLLEATPLHR